MKTKLKRISKKGVIFTMVSIVLSAIILAAFFFSQSTPSDLSVSSTEIRIKTINNFIKQMDVYIPNQIQSTSKSAIRNMTLQTIAEDRYYTPLGNSFQVQLGNCLRTKMYRINGLGVPNTNCGHSLQEKLDALENLSIKEFNINTTLTLREVHIYQKDPWHAIIAVNVSIDIVDSYAQWHINKTYEGNISIIGLPDPTYSIDVDNSFTTGGFDYRQNFTTEEPFNGWQNYPSTLNRLALEKKYFAFPSNSPNFISRLNGNLDSKDETGIASIIIYEPGMPFDKDISSIDYAYWRQEICAEQNTYAIDFYNPSMSPQERSNLEVPEAGNGPSINATILSTRLLAFTNMSNPDYHVGGPNCIS